MKIFFDTSALSRRFGGIPVYTRSLLNELIRKTPDSEFHTGIKTIRRNEMESFRQKLYEYVPETVQLHWKRMPGRLDFNAIPILRRLTCFNTDGYDVVHITNNLCFPWMMVSSWHNVIMTVHDMFPFHPEFPILDYSEYIKKNFISQIRAAAHIITDSRFSRDDICRIAGVATDKVTVIPLAAQTSCPMPNEETLLEKYQLHKHGFFLSVGSFYPHKNYAGLISAFESFMQTPAFRGQDLVIAGHPDRAAGASALNQRIAADPHIRILEDLTDGELQRLYLSAAGFFAVSFMEGFGIPLLEAMRAGCPACYSRGTSMDDIGRDAAFSVNPRQTDEIVSQMVHFAGMTDAERAAVRETEQRIAAEYSWERAARETLAVYQKIFQRKGMHHA